MTPPKMEMSDPFLPTGRGKKATARLRVKQLVYWNDVRDHSSTKSPAQEEAAVFTCDDCRMQRRCKFAFDSYNTDGDCLASK